jgi:hypothetical protein
MGFDINRLRRSDRIVGISAIAFFVFLFFFKWYGGSATASIGSVSYSASATGWDTFTNSRWIWLLTIGVALFAVLLHASGRDLEGPVRLGLIVASLGALSTLLILYRIVHHPSGASSGTVAGVHFSSSYGIKIGIWLGLLAAAALTYGGYVAMREEGASLSDPLGARSDTASVTSASEAAVADAHQGGADAPAPTPPLPPPVGADDPPAA